MSGSLPDWVDESFAEYQRFSALTTGQQIQTLKLDSIRDNIAADRTDRQAAKDRKSAKDRKPAESADQ
jgi:hypothetical protein